MKYHSISLNIQGIIVNDKFRVAIWVLGYYDTHYHDNVTVFFYIHSCC